MDPKERRGRRWRDWPMLVAVGIVLPILYVLSAGPACWVVSRRSDRGDTPFWMNVYFPLGAFFAAMDVGFPPRDVLSWWVTLGLPEDGVICVPSNLSGSKAFCIPKPAVRRALPHKSP